MHADQDDHRLALNDDTLLSRLRRTLAQERQVTAEVLRLMAEVDRRRLYAQFACDSMFAFATSVLRMSEAAAYKRIQVARAGRRFPALVEQIGAGRQHLSGLCVLVPHLTADNHHALLDAAAGLGKRQIERLVAERFPKPDVATSVRKLPTAARPSGTPSARSEHTMTTPTSWLPPAVQQPATAAEAEASPSEAVPSQQSPLGSTPQAERPEPAVATSPRHAQHHPQPLSADRYLLKVSVSGQLHGKLRHVQDLLRGQVPDGDIATVLEHALDALIAQQLKQKYAVGAKARQSTPQPQKRPSAEASPTAAPAPPPRSATSRPRAIPAAIRREVYQRDGGQCRFVDTQTGRRCQARAHLQFHHQLPFARGGPHSVGNVILLCRTHNAHFARRDYGAEHIQAAIDARAVANEVPTPPGAPARVVVLRRQRRPQLTRVPPLMRRPALARPIHRRRDRQDVQRGRTIHRRPRRDYR